MIAESEAHCNREGASGEIGEAIVQALEAMYKSSKSGRAEKV
jgi:hypothetical protein